MFQKVEQANTLVSDENPELSERRAIDQQALHELQEIVQAPGVKEYLLSDPQLSPIAFLALDELPYRGCISKFLLYKNISKN